MRKIIYCTALVASLAAGGAAAPTLAASTAALAPNDAPFCTSTTAQKELDQGEYQSQVQRPGMSLDSVDLWNGCVRATYTDSSGHISTAFYDPDTLRLLSTMGSDGQQG